MKRTSTRIVDQSGGRIKKNTLFIGISQAIQFILAFVLNWLAIRYLGAEDFGKYTFVSVLFYFVFLFDDFGIDTYVTREIAKKRERTEEFFINSLFLKLAFIGVSAAFLLTYLHLFSFSRDTTIAVLLFGLVGILYSFNHLCCSVYRAYERMEYEMLTTIIEKILITGFGIYVLTQDKGLVVFSSMFVFGSVFSLFLNLILIKILFVHRFAALDLAFMKQILKAAFLFGLLGFLTNIQERVGILMLMAMKSDAVVGWFGAAYKLMLVFATVPTILMTATFPRISKETSSNGKVDPNGIVSTIYTIGFKYLFFIAVPLIVGVLFLGDEVILFLFKSEFSQSAVVLKILIFATGFEFINIFIAGFLMACNFQKKLVYLQVSTFVLNILLNLFLIPRYGHIGASVAILVSYLVVLIVGLYLMHTKVCHLKEKAFFHQGLVASSVMLLFLLFRSGSLFAAIGSAVLIYSGVLFLMGGIRIQEILLLKGSST